MAVKLLYYFIFAFGAIMAFLLYQKPYQIEQNLSGKNEPNVEAFEVTNYSINKAGLSSIVNATKALRYNTHDEFYDVDAVRKNDKNILENIKADSGSLKKDDLKLVGNVRYRNSDGVKFNSKEAQYNLKTKVFKSNSDFVLENNSTITHGDSLVYQTKDGKIYAKNIRSQTEVKDK